MNIPADPGLPRRNILILLSNTWPYGLGENFLADEIPYLNECFDQVYVFPVNPLDKDSLKTSDVPDGIRVFPMYQDTGSVTASMPRLAIRGLKNFRRPEVRKELNTRAKGVKKRGVLAYFEGKSEQAYQHISSALEQESLVQTFMEGLARNEDLRIVVYSYWYFVSARVAVRLKEKLHTQIPDVLQSGGSTEVLAVSRGHGYDLNESVNRGAYLPYRAYLPEELDQSYPISAAGRRTLQENAPEAVDAISYARLGTMDDARAAQVVRAYKQGEVFHFVSCAWVSGVKRLDLLVEALARLDDWFLNGGTKANWHWTHLGGGPDLEKLIELAEQKLPQGNFTFKGQMKPAEIMEHYASQPCDLFCNVSSSEGVPVSVMEAFCFGIPALATDVGGTGEIVRPGVSGHLLPPDPDIHLVTRRLGEAVLRDSESRLAMRQTTRKLWETLCDGDKNYRRFARMLAGDLPLRGTVPPESKQLHDLGDTLNT